MPQPSLRASARTMPSAKPARIVGKALPDDLSHLPDRYAMPVIGDCLAPEIQDGAVIIVDRTVPYAPGDLVVLFRRPVEVGGQPRAMVKRLVMAPPSWVSFPWQDHPQSDVLALVIVEMLNPKRRIVMRCADILGIHKCVGPAPAGVTRSTVAFPDRHYEARPRRGCAGVKEPLAALAAPVDFSAAEWVKAWRDAGNIVEIDAGGKWGIQAKPGQGVRLVKGELAERIGDWQEATSDYGCQIGAFLKAERVDRQQRVD